MGIQEFSLVMEKAAYGSISGVTAFHLYGVNGAITTTHETIWDNSSLYTFLTANMSSPTVSSGSASDAAAGTGARTVVVSGVDSAYAAQSETVTLNGQTGVALVNSYMSINSVTVATAGSGGVNAGIVYVGTGSVTSGVPAVVHAYMAAGLNGTSSFIYTVPASKTLILSDFYASTSSTTAGAHNVHLRKYVNGGVLQVPLNSGFTTNQAYRHSVPLIFSEKTQLMCTASASAGTGPFYAHAHGLLVDANSSTNCQMIF